MSDKINTYAIFQLDQMIKPFEAMDVHCTSTYLTFLINWVFFSLQLLCNDETTKKTIIHHMTIYINEISTPVFVQCIFMHVYEVVSVYVQQRTV